MSINDIVEIDKQIKEYENKKKNLEEIQNKFFKEWISLFSIRIKLKEISLEDLNYEEKTIKAKKIIANTLKKLKSDIYE